MIRPSPLALAAVLCACAGTPSPRPSEQPVPAASRDERAGFLVRLGIDTLAGEQFVRAPDSLAGSSVLRSPALSRTYRAAIRPDGTVEQFELTSRRATLTVAPQRVTMTFAPGAVTVVTQVGDSTPRTARVDVDGPALPYVPNTYPLFELATRYASRAARTGGDTVRLTMVATIGRTLPLTVTRAGADSMLLSFAGATPYRARVDAEGRILGLEGTPTQRVSVTRTPSFDLGAISAERPLGTLSPTDTVRGQVGAAALTVVYSRPSKRGRTILGGVVPYDQVWRTGANAATTLTTTRDVTIGGARVPRGSYTLWSLPSPSGWKLIINRQTGQWGTEYDPARDLARVDMASTRTAQVTDQFTIAVDAAGGNRGQLRMLWDDFELTAPVVAR